MANQSESELDKEVHCTPPEIREAAAAVADSLLPTKSRKLYEKAYFDFMAWKSAKNITSMSERVFLEFFKDLSSSKTSTLWTLYSKLNGVLKIRHNLNLENFYQLKAFLKKHGENYSPKQATIFSGEEIAKFLNEAPDSYYLAMKVVCIFGIKGACKSRELLNVTMSDVQDYNDMLVIRIPTTKHKKSRQFIIDAEFYNIVKKYMTLRPEKTKSDRFFIKYQNGKCANQVIGIHKFGKMPQDIATFLELPDPTNYTGHSFRRTSANLLINVGGTMESLMRHGGRKSKKVAEICIDVPIHNTKSTAEMVTENIHMPSTSNAEHFENIETERFFEETEFRHSIFDPPKKKLKSSETPSTSAIEQNVNVQNTKSDANLYAKNMESRVANLECMDSSSQSCPSRPPSGTSSSSNNQLNEVKDEPTDVEEQTWNIMNFITSGGDQEDIIAAKDDFLITNMRGDSVLKNIDEERDPLDTTIEVKHEVVDIPEDQNSPLRPTHVLDVEKSFTERRDVARLNTPASTLSREHSPKIASKSCQVVQTGANLSRPAPKSVQRRNITQDPPKEDSVQNSVQKKPLYLLGRNGLAKKIASTVVQYLKTVNYQPSQMEWEEVIRNSLTIRDLSEIDADVDVGLFLTVNDC